MAPWAFILRLVDGRGHDFDLFYACFSLGAFALTWGIAASLLSNRARITRARLGATSPYRSAPGAREDELRLVLGVGPAAESRRAWALLYLEGGLPAVERTLSRQVFQALAARQQDMDPEVGVVMARLGPAPRWEVALHVAFHARSVEPALREALVAAGLLSSPAVRRVAAAIIGSVYFFIAVLGCARVIHVRAYPDLDSPIPIALAFVAIPLALAWLEAIRRARRTPRGNEILRQIAAGGVLE
jgi:hypothetical protein